ncbi:actin monomer binding protein [Diplodia corticola]|uniref:Twinfilin n=1 Tax=Diplodia corticola TaxID=236234 RepID=A0A1J9R6H8_9PEZI|nr:actin monomer binding protein [Diplodia corticola]OJD36137.1 actin monomer binding protein [Diplodia corticola]
MQSGITASAELHAAFEKLTTDPSSRFLIASVSGETIIPRDTIPASSDFLSDLSLLAPHLTPNEALYILLRQSDASSTDSDATTRLVAVTYVPDAAPVRQKTLTASTRLALVRQLGGEHFAETVFATTAEELSAEGWRRHEAHVAGAAPLTEEERNLVGIKEQEALESSSTAARRVQTSGHLSMEVQEGVVEALRGLPEGEANLVQLDIDVANETFRLVSTTTASAAELGSVIAADAPRYSFYRHDAGPDGSRPILFIYSCPPTSKVKERMVYAASRGFAIHLAEKEAGIEIHKRLEFGSPEDIGPSTIDDEFVVREEKKTGFSKPKRPGKR